MHGQRDVTFVPGTVIAGKYRVERVLGRGAMGAVALCQHTELEQRFAVKVLLPDTLSDASIRARFTHEARAAAKLASYHVARVSDVGTDPTLGPYIVMEYLEGQDLKALLEARGPLPVAEAVDYVLQAIDAIAEAHAHGIVHRDLKPANLFLAERPGATRMLKVLDFGISKIQSSSSAPSATASAHILGSPSYMSPEQVRETKNVDGRADVWSLGVVLYELLTNTVPFAAPSIAELLSSILVHAPRDIRAARPDLPEPLAAIVMRCLEKDVDQRIPDVAVLAHALEPFGTGQQRECVARASAQLRVRHDGTLDTVLAPPPSEALRGSGDAPAFTPSSGAMPLSPSPAGPTPQGPGTWQTPSSTRSSWDGGAPAPPMNRGGAGSVIVGAVLVCALAGMGLFVWRSRSPAGVANAGGPTTSAPAVSLPTASSTPPVASPPPSATQAPSAAPLAEPTPSATVAQADAGATEPSARPARPKPRPTNPDDLLDRRH